MFNYITVDFKNVTDTPRYVYSANLRQERYKHELLELRFNDWNINYDNITASTPVEVVFKGVGTKKSFYGYVHHIEAQRTPGKNFATVTVIGASYVFKTQSQDVYLNTTADQVVKKLATKHKFVCHAEPHPRVYPQISQAGHSDWELINRLAKQCGYTVRAENTELYFQPMLQDYATYRESAPLFTMREAQNIAGTEIYSFTPMIVETIPYDDATKSAVAVSGLDIYQKSPIKHTQPKANKKTKKKSKQEFFDSFDPLAVVLNQEVAKYEAEAAEARNSFPYRATVEVIGDPRLKPNYPVYLDGLGENYSGYWIVLKAEHKVIEERRNVQKYTTVIEVGTDSLGSANTWTDNKRVASPDPLGKRSIIPGVKQTVVVPTSSLSKTSNINSPQLTAPFGSTENRETTFTSGQAITPDVWKSDLSSLNTITVETTRSPVITSRIQRNLLSI